VNIKVKLVDEGKEVNLWLILQGQKSDPPPN